MHNIRVVVPAPPTPSDSLRFPFVANLGMQGEHGVSTITFDLSELYDKYGVGTCVLSHRRPTADEAEQRDCAVLESATELVWTVGAWDTYYSGVGAASIAWQCSSGTKKVEFKTMCRASIVGGDETGKESGGSGTDVTFTEAELQAMAARIKTEVYGNG